MLSALSKGGVADHQGGLQPHPKGWQMTSELAQASGKAKSGFELQGAASEGCAARKSPVRGRPACTHNCNQVKIAADETHS